MWLAHVFGQKGAKNKIKLTKAGAHVFGQISYRFTVKKKKRKKKKEIEHKAGALAKKKEEENEEAKKKKGVKATGITI